MCIYVNVCAHRKGCTEKAVLCGTEQTDVQDELHNSLHYCFLMFFLENLRFKVKGGKKRGNNRIIAASEKHFPLQPFCSQNDTKGIEVTLTLLHSNTNLPSSFLPARQ